MTVARRYRLHAEPRAWEDQLEVNERVHVLASLLAAGDRDARGSLADVLGRPELGVAYWLPDDDRWVGPDGRLVDVDPSAPGVTVVTHRRRRVAALLLDPPGDLDGDLLAVAGLALANERLELARGGAVQWTSDPAVGVRPGAQRAGVRASRSPRGRRPGLECPHAD